MIEHCWVLYRCNAVGQVIFTGTTQKFVLWQLAATERTGGCFLLQL